MSNLKDTPLSGVLLPLFLIFFLYNLIKVIVRLLRIRRDWYSFRIIRAEGSITKKQHNTPDLEILDEEISRIVQITGGLSIQTNTPEKFIFIPSSLNSFNELVFELNHTKIVEVSPITSVGVPAEHSLLQHVKKGAGSAVRTSLILFGIIFGGLLVMILFLFLVIFLLSS
jgi:hypothetical protein